VSTIGAVARSVRRKLRARMGRSASGWRARDLERLYRGFGFVKRQRGPHDVYFHPRFPHLTATVTRASGTLPPGYVEAALDLLDALDALVAQARSEADDRPAG
jgi:hypothetical protein